VEVGEVADVVDEHRTPVAARRRPAVDPRAEHEVVQDQLAASIDEIEQARLAVRAFESVVLVPTGARRSASASSSATATASIGPTSRPGAGPRRLVAAGPSSI
jgi:hypothetical protein